MRKIITIILCAWCCLSASAQYSIYSVSGDVKIKPASSAWVKAKKGAEIALQDSICVGNNARVQVLNKQTSQIFESTGSGVFTIIKLITNARKQSGRVITELNKEMYHNARADNSRSVSFVGASTRGDEESLADSLYFCIQSDLADAEPLPEGLIIKPIRKKKLFYLKLDNQSDKGLYINLLIRNTRTGEKACAYTLDLYEQPCLYIAPKTSLSLEQFRFVASKECEYILWATERPYDSNRLQNLLSSPAPTDHINSTGIKVFAKKMIP